MIHDGFWNNDLLELANEISFWHNKINKLFAQHCTYRDTEVQIAEHNLNKNIFFSATIIRKIVEEEYEYYRFHSKCIAEFGEPTSSPKKFHIVHSYQVKTIKFPLKPESENLFEDYCIDDYDKTIPQKQSYPIKDISNWILHSYVWGLDFEKESRLINGFYLSSDYDKSKFVNYITIREWINSIKYCAEHAWL